jgi:hypothetical protein
MMTHRCACILIGMALGMGRLQAADPQTVSIESLPGKFRVTVQGQLFAEVDYQSYAKTIVYPILGPHQIPMTRNYPMKGDVSGEPKDHPHHKSMWFAHGDVNGVSYWDERGRIVNEKAEQVGPQAIRLTNRLTDPAQSDGPPVCRETIQLSFGAEPDARWIDWDISLHADPHEVKLGDTKEGTMALRVHPNLQLENDPRQGVTTANGQAVNSEGVRGPDVWGKRAMWVDYFGTIEGRMVGIAFFDHPENLRHPTYWHARAYGLFSANPFGLSEFVGSGADGAHTIPAGQSLRLRYRFLFHDGDPTQARVAERYGQYK